MRIRNFMPSWNPVFDNDLDALVPEKWAQDCLMELEPFMMASQVVYRDYKNEIARNGDTVNVTVPAGFLAKRKGVNDDVAVQNAEATTIPVVLNQHLYTTFFIRDGEEALGFKSLRNLYIKPAMLAIARGLDQIVLGQVYQFLGNVSGKIGTPATRSLLIDGRETMNRNLAPTGNRNLFITPTVEGQFLNTDDFSHVDKSGSTAALIEGSLGRKYGWNIYMAQNTPSVTVPGTTITTAVDLAAGYAAGSTAMVIDDGQTEDTCLGCWFTVAGDMIPHRIIAFDAATDTMTFEPALKSAVANDAVVTIYDKGTVDLAAGYDAGWVKDMKVADFGTIPGAGRLVTFGTATGAEKYSLMSTATANSILLDHPLAADADNDAVIGAGPVGEYCFGFQPEAMALVMRPLPLPARNSGANAAIAQYRDLGLRVCITYEGRGQGHLVTIDMLAGIKVLNTSLGAVLLA